MASSQQVAPTGGPSIDLAAELDDAANAFTGGSSAGGVAASRVTLYAIIWSSNDIFASWMAIGKIWLTSHYRFAQRLAIKQTGCPMPEGTVQHVKIEKWDGTIPHILGHKLLQQKYQALHQRALAEADLQYISDEDAIALFRVLKYDERAPAFPLGGSTQYCKHPWHPWHPSHPWQP